MIRKKPAAAAATIAIGAAAAMLGTGPATASPVRKPASNEVTTCARANVVKPSGYLLACGDGAAGLADIRWTAWGTSLAAGQGLYWWKTCVPDCAAGPVRYERVTVYLGAAAVERGVRHYTSMQVISESVPPKGGIDAEFYYITPLGPVNSK
jgi:hypothetical protein